MTATLTSTDLDNDRCPRCGIHLSGTDVVDKAKAWTAMAEKNAEIERLKEARVQDALAQLEHANVCSAEIERLRAALRWGIGASLNEMTVLNLPLEWSPESGIGKMLAALGINADRMTPEVRRELSKVDQRTHEPSEVTVRRDRDEWPDRQEPSAHRR